jgi:serine/threonine protein kinase
MTSERWLRVKEIFNSACDLAPTDCAAFLAEACGVHRELRREVESLLAEDGSRAGILDQPATSVAAAGKQFGPYRIEASIGKGGMGEVWKARDSRLNRDVAIKISAQQFSV